MDERDREALMEMRECVRQAMAWAREGGHTWTSDAKTVAAVAHMVAQIGEAARRVSIASRSAHAEVPWSALTAMRNRIYHDYGGLDLAVLRETVRRDLLALRGQLETILKAPRGTEKG